jgi:hypothetical protein
LLGSIGGSRTAAPNATLLGFIDDATSRLMHLQFVESGSTFAYYHSTRAYLEVWGKPVAFSDKHRVFLVNHPGALGGDASKRATTAWLAFRAATGRSLRTLTSSIRAPNLSSARDSWLRNATHRTISRVRMR